MIKIKTYKTKIHLLQEKVIGFFEDILRKNNKKISPITGKEYSLIREDGRFIEQYGRIIGMIGDKSLNYFFEKIDDNILYIQDILDGEIDITNKKSEEIDLINIFYLLQSNFGLLNIDKGFDYKGAIKNQGYIFIEKEGEIVGITDFNLIIKSIDNNPPFFGVTFNDFILE